MNKDDVWKAAGWTSLAVVAVFLAINPPRLHTVTDQKAPAERQALDTGDAAARSGVTTDFEREALVASRLRDPESARFRHLRGGCGFVNARNGFGGMTGWQPFIVTAEGAVELFEADPDTFRTHWNGRCNAVGPTL